ncbi:MAG TPA: VCBS repeat-containing protein [Planctomycetaceae bacterium]|nr:VCBS repeat-containing protein [Planctomycetaceae bacterium]
MSLFQHPLAPLLVILVAIEPAAGLPVAAHADEPRRPWARHTIDDSSRGADGVRLADVNGDGLPDIATGWEEGGRVRVCLHPGPDRVRELWPGVTVGTVRSPEDAVFIDLDGDGAIDVVSSCEGRTRTLFVHWAPRKPSRSLDAMAWTTEALPASQGQSMWMFCLPMQVDGRRGVDLVCGSKGEGAGVVWWESPENPRDLAAWQPHAIAGGGWIMSLLSDDVDGDGDLDVIVSDRKGPLRGCWWLENPARPDGLASQAWTRHPIGGQGREVMFMAQGDVDGDGRQDLVAAVHRDDLLIFRRTGSASPAWETIAVPMPPDTGGGKGVAIGDIDGDGQADLVFSCEGAEEKQGVMWLSREPGVPLAQARWSAHPISGTAEGVKYDLVELLDLDGDGDLDVLTCEERDNLGVVWYENPRLGRR